MPDGIQTFNLPGIAQAAETVKASRFTNRVNEIRLQDAQRKAQREETKRGIFQGAVGPAGEFDPQAAQRGLFQGGFVEEAFDLQKVETEQQKASADLRGAVASARGEELENVNTKLNLFGTAALGLTQAYQSQIDQGKQPQQAIQGTQPLYERVVQSLQNQGVDTSNFPTQFDPNTALAMTFASKDAIDAAGAAQTRGLAERKFEVIEKPEAERKAEEGKRLSATDVKSLATDFTKESIDKFQKTRKAIDLEVKPLETPTPEDDKARITFEGQQQAKFTKASQNFVGLQNSFTKIETAAAAASAAGDLSMIFAFMKMLDPTSVVREGEQASAANARGVPAATRQIYNRALKGEKLAPEQRIDFVDRANDIFKTELERHKRRETEFGRVATNSGLRLENVIIDFIDPQFKTQAGGRKIDRATAQEILREVGGDKERARQIAKERGLSF